MEWEFIGMAVVNVAVLIYVVGRRSQGIDTMDRDQGEIWRRLDRHEEACAENHEKIQQRFEEGSKKMTELETTQKHILGRLDRIEDKIDKLNGDKND